MEDIKNTLEVSGYSVDEILEASAAVDSVAGVTGFPMALSYKLGKLKRAAKEYKEAYTEAVNAKREELSEMVEQPVPQGQPPKPPVWGIPPKKHHDFNKASAALAKVKEPAYKPEKFKTSEFEKLDDKLKDQMPQGFITALVMANVLTE